MCRPSAQRDAVPEDIMAATLVKFKQDDCRFDDRASYNLMYPDGRAGRMLPDESAPFILDGYKVIEGVAYSRLRPTHRLEISFQSASFVVSKLALQLVLRIRFTCVRYHGREGIHFITTHYLKCIYTF